jgi:hypothetical protein
MVVCGTERDGRSLEQENLEQIFLFYSANKFRPCNLAALQDGNSAICFNSLQDARFAARFSAVTSKNFRCAIGGRGRCAGTPVMAPAWSRKAAGVLDGPAGSM